MNINWEVRLRNKTFWVTAGSAVLLLAKQIAASRGVEIPVQEISTLIDTVLTILVAAGIIIDPTTEGVSDSKRALTYRNPQS